MGESWLVKSLIYGRVWGEGRRFRSLHLVIKYENFMRKYEDLYDIYITLEGKLAYELNTNKDCDE